MPVLTEEGKVTIPADVREILGLQPGSEVSFELTPDGKVVMRNAGPEVTDRFARVRGSAGPGMTTDEIMALVRGDYR